MKYGICHLSIIPVRKDPSDRSEMVSQLLFGEDYKVTKDQGKWLRIKGSFDNYEGWIDHRQFKEISKTSFEAIQKKISPAVAEFVGPIEFNNNGAYPILLGSSIPKLKELDYQFKGEIFQLSNPTNNRSLLVENAYMYLNSPYLWGGRSPFGIDCSGFTQMVYKLNGIKLPRDAYQQAEVGDSLSFIEEAEVGDLAFFDNSEGKIIHVGIMLNNNQIIHASGKVRIDRIDHQGIFNQETNDYSHHLRLIKKVFQ